VSQDAELVGHQQKERSGSGDADAVGASSDALAVSKSEDSVRAEGAERLAGAAPGGQELCFSPRNSRRQIVPLLRVKSLVVPVIAALTNADARRKQRPKANTHARPTTTVKDRLKTRSSRRLARLTSRQEPRKSLGLASLTTLGHTWMKRI